MVNVTAFILTYDWQDISGRNTLRFQGITAEGQPVEVIIENNKPVFFISHSVPAGAVRYRHERKDVSLSAVTGVPVDAVYFATQKDLKAAAADLNMQGIRTYESDIDPARRYLMERFINAQMSITGNAISKGKLLRFINPTIKPAEITPEFKVLSLDIETGVKSNELYSIAVHLTGACDEQKLVFMNGRTDAGAIPEYLKFYGNERELLIKFLEWFNAADPDIIIGWNVIGFDLMFIEEKCKAFSVLFDLARGSGKAVFGSRKNGGYFSFIPGRVVIDGPPSLRSSFYSFEDFRLETVSRELLGTGKTISAEKDKIQEIENLYKNDKVRLAEYNLQDTVLVTGIFKKTGIIDQFIKRSQISGLMMDELGMMTAAFDHFYLPRLHRSGYIAIDVRDVEVNEQSPGGYVIEPKPGIYKNVAVLDFKSLYPSIIRTFKIGPLSHLLAKLNPITTPGGYKFSRDSHFLADFIGELMEKREEAKKKGDRYLSQAIKILMNSFYGVMGSPGCRFFHSDLASAITTTGHWLLLGSRNYFEERGYGVLYGDTDSLFVQLKPEDAGRTEECGRKLAAELNQYWQERIENEFEAASHLEIEFEKIYQDFVLTSARGGDYGAKKRYAGLTEKKGKAELEFTGMEFVRSDWTRLAKDFQVELYMRVFNGEEIKDWLNDYVSKIKRGQFNDKLVYRKRLRKEADDYVKNIPPQVKAARMINKTRGSIDYVITKRGPIPVELEHSDYDYTHYIDKQIKPVADSLLNLLGYSFDSIIESIQLDFFKD